MAHFTTGGKRYREGTDFPAFGSADVGTVSNGTSFEAIAPPTLPDGETFRSFLFWDTGRRLTGKRHVRWSFNNVANWSTWHATAWYGTLGGNGGEPVVHADAYWVGSGTMDPTPIDGAASSFVNGPAADQLAYPWQGDDHAVRTEWGPATIRALSHLQRSATDPQLDFSSLTKVAFGGEDPGTICEETDDGITAGGGITGIASTTAQELTYPQGSGGLVIAGYVQPVAPTFSIPFIDIILEWLGHVKVPLVGDPGPDDIVRLKLIAESLDLVRGEHPSDIDAFEGLLGAAQKMSATQLKRTIVSTRATVRRGEATIKSLEALAAKRGAVKG